MRSSSRRHCPSWLPTQHETNTVNNANLRPIGLPQQTHQFKTVFWSNLNRLSLVCPSFHLYVSQVSSGLSELGCSLM